VIEYKNPNFYGNGKTEGEGRKVKRLLEHDELTVNKMNDILLGIKLSKIGV